MKLIKLKNSILLLRINPDNDSVKCYFIFFISWNCFKSENTSFDFAVINMGQIKAFYKNLANDWTGKYRV